MNAEQFQRYVLELEEEITPLVEEWMVDTLAPVANLSTKKAIIHESDLPLEDFGKFKSIMEKRGFVVGTSDPDGNVIISWEEK